MLGELSLKVCGCRGNWTHGRSFVDSETVVRSEAQVGDRRSVSAASRVASTRRCSGARASKAIGDQLTCIFVDNGLLRAERGERGGGSHIFRDDFGIPLVSPLRGREAEFLGRPAKASRTRRRSGKIIGRHVHRGVRARRLKQHRRQGGPTSSCPGHALSRTSSSRVSFTWGPRRRSRPTTTSAGCPNACSLEAGRAAARALQGRGPRGRAQKLGNAARGIFGRRHPFPGPGLAIRIRSARSRRKRLEILRREADAIVIEEIRAAGLYDKIWQAFAVFLPVRTGGRHGRRAAPTRTRDRRALP